MVGCIGLIVWCDWFGFCSEEEARMKIYSVSTRHYFAFGALVSEELSYKIKGICVVVFNLRVLFMFCASEFFLKKNLVFVFLELQNCLEFGGCFLILTWMLRKRIMEVKSLVLLPGFLCIFNIFEAWLFLSVCAFGISISWIHECCWIALA